MNQQLMMGILLALLGIIVLPTQVIMPLWGDIQEKQGHIAEKKASLETLTTSVATLQGQVVRLQQVKALPEGVRIRTVTPEEETATVKDLLDDVVLLAGHLGNDLISLEPAKAGRKETTAPAPKEPEAPKKNAKTKAATAKAVDATEEATPPRVEAQSHDYTVVVRGTYTAIQALLNALANHPDLIEVKSMELTNEGGSDRQEILLGNLKVNKPMRATLQLTLWLMPPVLGQVAGGSSSPQAVTPLAKNDPMP